MTDKYLSGLENLSIIVGDEVMPIENSTKTYVFTPNQLRDFYKSSLPEAIAGTNNTKFLTPYLASNLPIVRVVKTTPQNLVDSVATKITGFSIDLNVGNYWNAGTQKFIPPAGIYQLNLGTNAVSNANYGNIINLSKNGVVTIYGLQMSGFANQQNKVSYSEVVTANGTDEFEVYSLMFGSGTLTLQETIFSMYKIR